MTDINPHRPSQAELGQFFEVESGSTDPEALTAANHQLAERLKEHIAGLRVDATVGSLVSDLGDNDGFDFKAAEGQFRDA